MSSSDLSEQAAQVEKLLYQLKEDGYEFPGRMRDHVAQVVQTSKTKLAKLKIIRDNLASCWQPRYKRNKIAEDVAYSLAQLPKEWQQSIYDVIGENGYISTNYVKTYMERFQKIDNLKCKKCGRNCSCQNVTPKRKQAIEVPAYSPFNCGKCCGSCSELISCKNACSTFATKVKQMRADKREARRQEKLAQEEKDRPQIEQIQALWMRFGYERERSKKSVKAVFDAQGRYYCKDDDKKFKELEDCTAKITIGTKLPYNYNCYLPEITRLIAVADLFGCSLDYLFCRTDVREMAQDSPKEKESQPDTDQIVPGLWYPASVEPPIDAEIIMVDKYDCVSDDVYLGCGTLKDNIIMEWKDAVLWTLLPKEAASMKPSKAAEAVLWDSSWTNGRDDLLPDAIDIVLETGQASVSMLQRRLKLGYARASKIIDEMEGLGIVGPFRGSGLRAILMTPERWADIKKQCSALNKCGYLEDE